MRPVMPETCPEDFIGFQNYDEKTFVTKAGREVWGMVVYMRRLSQKELCDYEMIPEIRKNIPLSERVSGERLEYATEVLDALDSIGAWHDEYGNIKLYHHTNEKNATLIKKEKKMRAKENGLFFSTKKDGQAECYGDTTVEFCIPVELLELDDVFDDEFHFRYPLIGKNRILDVSQYISIN